MVTYDKGNNEIRKIVFIVQTCRWQSLPDNIYAQRECSTKIYINPLSVKSLELIDCSLLQEIPLETLDK